MSLTCVPRRGKSGIFLFSEDAPPVESIISSHLQPPDHPGSGFRSNLVPAAVFRRTRSRCDQKSMCRTRCVTSRYIRFSGFFRVRARSFVKRQLLAVVDRPVTIIGFVVGKYPKRRVYIRILQLCLLCESAKGARSPSPSSTEKQRASFCARDDSCRRAFNRLAFVSLWAGS